MVADSLRSKPERATPLAQLIHEKTTGNPFFAIQFISALADEELLSFDYGNARWSWDLNRIRAKGYTDNVVDLMVGKLSRLSVETQKALQQLACMGNRAEFATLNMVCQHSEEMHDQLWQAVQAGLIFRSEDSYRFLHDRVQEAAYSSIPQELRAEAHLRIGLLLARHTPPDRLKEGIFEIVNQLNRGSYLITSTKEREQVADLNLIAGRRAKISTAYDAALKYLAAGRVLLTEDIWDNNYELIFAIEYLMAECELLTADMMAAEDRLAMLVQRARSGHDIAVVTRLRLTLYTTLDQSDRGVEACLEYLRRGGTDWSLRPTHEDVQGEYDRIWSQIGGRTIEELIDLPLMTNPDVLDTLDVLTEAVTPAYFWDENLSSLVICHMVNLSLEHGNSDGSCFAYVWFAIIAGPRFGNYKDGFRFGRLGYELVEKRGLKRYEARTYMCFGNIVMPWTRHAREGRDLVRRAFDAANRVGDLTFAAYSCNQLITNFLTVGDPLLGVQPEAEAGLAFARKARFGLVVDLIVSQLGLIRTLRGLTPKFDCFDHDEFDELRFERHLASNSLLALAEFWYWARKVQARFLAADYTSAVDASFEAKRLLWTSPSQFETAEYHFYGALSHAAFWDSASPAERQQHFEVLAAHHRQLEIWAANCPENFANRAALAGAEIARIEGRDRDAMHLYEQAIRSARENGFVHNEGVANEAAGRFYLARGLETNAYAHLRNASTCFALWGADGKVQQLEMLYPRLASPEGRQLTAATGTSVQQLDVATVVEASQAVSSEIVLPRLIERLMAIALRNAGADRGLLLLAQDDGYRVEAEGRTSGDEVEVRQWPSIDPSLPETIIRYVSRTQERVILEDASKPNLFSGDEYLSRRQPRSLLSLALVRQGTLTGLLYLENTLTSHAFTPARTAVLELLASQAAISLENARLYGDLQEREARVRRLVDSNIIGIFIWDLEGRITDANEAFLHIVEYGREDLISGHLCWTELTATEWRDTDERAAAEVMATGTVRPYEKELLRRDGSRVPVLIGAAAFGRQRDQGVAFVLDLTERKRAEEQVRESERRYHQVQMELAHANRVATMGQLSASIAHEVNQPIAATVTNAEAALIWLRAHPPDLEEARAAIGRIVRDGNRASHIVGRIRALVKRAPAQRDALAINEAILEVMALTRSEMIKNGVSLRTQLADDLPLIQGDRIGLQQVILNLAMNAIQAMSGMNKGPRELLIRTETAESDSVLVSVSDTGPGLGLVSGERLFQAFYTTKPDGLGMGLSICRSIVETHAGQLWVTRNARRGAAFQFTVPANPASVTTS